MANYWFYTWSYQEILIYLCVIKYHHNSYPPMEVDSKVYFIERYFDKNLCQYDIYYVDLVLCTHVSKQGNRSITPLVGSCRTTSDSGDVGSTLEIVANASERFERCRSRLRPKNPPYPLKMSNCKNLKPLHDPCRAIACWGSTNGGIIVTTTLLKL